jgi:hypothetical protein
MSALAIDIVALYKYGHQGNSDNQNCHTSLSLVRHELPCNQSTRQEGQEVPTLSPELKEIAAEDCER